MNYELILTKVSKNVSKPTRTLDYAILKFTSSTPALDYAIIKLLRPLTRQWRHRMRLFPWTLWYRNGDAATKNGRIMKIWKSFCIPIFMNFDKLNINYELILSKIYKNGPKTHPHPWLRNIKIHIIGPSPWLRDNKMLAPTHTTMACATPITL